MAMIFGKEALAGIFPFRCYEGVDSIRQAGAPWKIFNGRAASHRETLLPKGRQRRQVAPTHPPNTPGEALPALCSSNIFTPSGVPKSQTAEAPDTSTRQPRSIYF